MWLPNVTEQGWREFQRLMAEEFDTVLSDVEAKRLAQQALNLTFILEYGSSYLRPKIDG